MDIVFLVRVSCMTYNHAPYIDDAMNGFCMQETSFPFVCTIVDDASTDGEQEVIKKYLQENFDLQDKSIVRNEETDDYLLTFARHKTNHNCFFAVLFLKYNHYRKKSKAPYIKEWSNTDFLALCEGDDYWIDPLKLQKQVDYFRKYPGCGLVYTAYRQQNDVTSLVRDVFTSPSVKHDETFKWKLLEQKVLIGTCTTLIDNKLRCQITDLKDDFEGFLMGDTQTWFNAARIKGVGYIPEVTGVYRKQEIGETATFDLKRRGEFIRGCLNMHLHLAYKYGAPQKTIIIIKKLFGFPCFNLFFCTKSYEKAQEVNREFFRSNKMISFLISLAKKMEIKHFCGFSTILILFSKIGVIDLK